MARPAGIPEWPKGAGCKPAGSAFGGSNPPPCTRFSAEEELPSGSPSSRESKTLAAQAESQRPIAPRQRDPVRATLATLALLAQSVEHLHGKEGVDGSSPSEGLALRQGLHKERGPTQDLIWTLGQIWVRSSLEPVSRACWNAIHEFRIRS
jgi:hypothetical protein